MDKKIVRNIVFAILAICILGGIYFGVTKWTAQDETNQAQQGDDLKRLLELSVADIANVSVENQKGRYTIIHKDDDTYELELRQDLSFSQAKFAAFINQLTRLVIQYEVSSDGQNLADFGLDIPQAKVRIGKKDGTTNVLLIGDKAPGSQGYYCMSEEQNKIVIIQTYQAESFLGDINNFRNTSITTIDKESLKGFSLSKGSEKIVEMREIRSDDKGAELFTINKLYMEYPYKEFVSAERFDKITEKFASVTADSFAADNLSDISSFGLDNGYKLTIVDGNGEHRFTFGNTASEGKVYATYNDDKYVYVIDSSLLDSVKDIKPFEYIEKFIHIFPIKQVEKINVNIFGENYEFTSDGEEKYYINGKEIQKDPWKKAYQTISGVMITSETTQPRTDNTVATVTFTFKDGTQDSTTYYEYDERNYGVKCSDGSYFLVLKKNVQAMADDIKNAYTQ